MSDYDASDSIFDIEPEAPEPEATSEETEAEIEIDTPSKIEDSGYGDDAIQTLDWNEHIRRRPGMYIGKLGDGSHAEDGIYVLIKEVVDNSIDEFNMGAGKRIEIKVDAESGEVEIRDFGRGIPLGKVKEVASDINTGGKFDDKNFKKSVGLNGVGLKAVNALSTHCEVVSYRDGECVRVEFDRGNLVEQTDKLPTTEETALLYASVPTRHSSATIGLTWRPSKRWSTTIHISTPDFRSISTAEDTCRATASSICLRRTLQRSPSTPSSICRATTSKW